MTRFAHGRLRGSGAVGLAWLLAVGCEPSGPKEDLGGSGGDLGGAQGAGGRIATGGRAGAGSDTPESGGQPAEGGSDGPSGQASSGGTVGSETGGAASGGSSEDGGSGGNVSGGAPSTGGVASGGSGGSEASGGSGAGGSAVVHNCVAFVDRTDEAADRGVLWNQDIAADPERCMEILVGQNVTWTANFTNHPLLPSGGDLPTPITTDYPSSGDHVVAFPSEGTFGFVCESHTEMRGAVRVLRP